MADQINHKLIEVTIEQKSSEEKEWKDKTLWNVKIKVEEEWHYGTVWNEKDFDAFQALPDDKPVLLMFYQVPYNDNLQNKFRIPYKSDLLQKENEILKMWKQDAIDKYPDLKDMQVPD